MKNAVRDYDKELQDVLRLFQGHNALVEPRVTAMLQQEQQVAPILHWISIGTSITEEKDANA